MKNDAKITPKLSRDGFDVNSIQMSYFYTQKQFREIVLEQNQSINEFDPRLLNSFNQLLRAFNHGSEISKLVVIRRMAKMLAFRLILIRMSKC